MKISRNNISEHLFEKQLSIIGRTVKDAIDNPNWRQEWAIPPEDALKFREYAVPLIKKTFRCNSNKAHNTFNFFLITFGLKIY